MRLTSLRAQNVLSFGEFELDLGERLNVVVGPNGAGKSNVTRLVGLVVAGLRAAAGAGGELVVGDYLRLGEPTRRGTVSLGIEFTEAAETALLLTFVRAVAASFVNRAQHYLADSREEYAFHAQVTKAVNENHARSLATGYLVIHLNGGPPPLWSLAYEFNHNGSTYHLWLGGHSPVSTLMAGPASAYWPRSWSSRQREISHIFDQPGREFNLGEILPEVGEPISWTIRNPPNGEQSIFVRDLLVSLGYDKRPDAQISLATVLEQVMAESLVSTVGLRRPPRTLYRVSELGARPWLDDAGDLPLELLRCKVGGSSARARYRQIQELFYRLTGQHMDVRAEMVRAAEGEAGEIRVSPIVATVHGDVAITLAGAGMWEALVACSTVIEQPGRVVILDEPAVNLHPSWQRQLLNHLAMLDQVILITHSPYLVPSSFAEDLRRITLLRQGHLGTEAASLRHGLVSDRVLNLWRQILGNSAEARSALFAQGVLMVEGETDHGAFGAWFSDPRITGDAVRGLDALSFLPLEVGSDTRFGSYVSFLQAFGIPWAIICDGKVLSPAHHQPMVKQLMNAGVILPDLPPDTSTFAEWKEFWSQNGVFTVANRFGDVKDKADKSGEIEAFFERLDPALWREVQVEFPRSKSRAGFEFAVRADISANPTYLDELVKIWTGIKRRLESVD